MKKISKSEIVKELKEIQKETEGRIKYTEKRIRECKTEMLYWEKEIRKCKKVKDDASLIYASFTDDLDKYRKESLKNLKEETKEAEYLTKRLEIIVCLLREKR